MEEQKLIEALSKLLNETEIMQKFLQENLSVSVSTEQTFHKGYEYIEVKISVYFGDKEVCTSSDSFRNNNG